MGQVVSDELNSGWLHRCSPTDGSAPGLNSDGGADLGRVTKLLLLLLVRFATFLSAILSGMWAEWLLFSLNRYVKHACVCVAWLNLCLNPAGFFFFFAAELVSGWAGCSGLFCSLNFILSLSSSPTEFPVQNDICALRERKKEEEGVSLKLLLCVFLTVLRCITGGWLTSPVISVRMMFSSSVYFTQ